MAAEARRIEAALPRGARRIALDEHGERVTTAQLAERLLALAARRPRRRASDRRPRRARPGAEGELRRDAAPVRPDAAACLRARAARRGAVPRLVGHRRPSVPPRMSAAPASLRLPRVAEPAPAPAARRRSASATSCCCRAGRGRRGARGRARRRAARRLRRARHARQARRGADDGSPRAACPPAPILCADTTVALGRRILGKPRRRRRRARASSACSPAARTA